MKQSKKAMAADKAQLPTSSNQPFVIFNADVASFHFESGRRNHELGFIQ